MRKPKLGPLKKVIHAQAGSYGWDYLECGHRLVGAQDIYGRRYPARRRCWKCNRGDPADFSP